MIIFWLLNILVLMINGLFSLLPIAPGAQLPWGTDAYVVYAVGLFKYFAYLFPPFQIVFTATLIYLGFRGFLLLFKLILGARSPISY